MAIINHERVGKALELLKAGLGPFVERELKNAFQAETARELAYRLYTICERKKRAAEALAYNALVQSWPEITRLAREGAVAPAVQPSLI
jgi:putative DNA methylase